MEGRAQIHILHNIPSVLACAALVTDLVDQRKEFQSVFMAQQCDITERVIGLGSLLYVRFRNVTKFARGVEVTHR